MISIKVTDNTEENVKLLKPSEVVGDAHGTIYRMYCHEKPIDTYLISTGTNDRPICIWWDDESGNWRLSSYSKKDLKELSSRVRVKECEYAKIKINLIID